MVQIIDTMMIGLKLDEETFNEFFSHVNDFLRNHKLGKLWYDKKIPQRYVTTKLSPRGFLEIAFYKVKFSQYMEVKLQPIRLLKENELVELCRFEYYFEVETSFNDFWREILGFEVPEYMRLKNWQVSRIDYAFQFKTPYLKTYLELFKRGQLSDYFTAHEYETSVYATADTANLNFYDKGSQLKAKPNVRADVIKSAENILRLEVQCKGKYLQKLKKNFKLKRTHVIEFWNVCVAEHALTYRIKMLVGKPDFYRIDVANKKLREKAGNEAIRLQALIREIAQADNITLGKENFCRNRSGISPEKCDKLLSILRKKFEINPLTFPADKKLPPMLKNPCALLIEDFQRSKEFGETT